MNVCVLRNDFVNVSRASPVLQAEEVIEVVAHKGSDLLEVMCPDASCQQRLVGVSESGVHQ